jgi:DNA-binding NtrC family response regulator
MAKILLIDDDRLVRGSTKGTLSRAGHEVDEFANGMDATANFEKTEYQVILCDMKMPGLSGIDVLSRIKAINENIPFIIMTAYGTVETAVDAMKKGAYDFIEKPFSSPDEIELLITRALEVGQLREENKSLKEQLRKKYQFIGKSKPMKEVDHLIKAVASTRSTVLISGESGTGKELVARAIHMQSPRANRPFVKINCAALPETLIESELFGHKKGSFTGALRDTKGKFEQASGGTLLLDEISEMPLNMQAKLLRVLQEREIDKVGGEEPILVDVRILATTNRDLAKEVTCGNFREDLFYRLNVVPVCLPPLRDKKEDIAELAVYFIRQFNEENGIAVEGVEKEAMEKLKAYHWPGNIRELENAIERAVVLQKSGWIQADLFKFSDLQRGRDPGGMEAADTSIADMEKRMIFKTLDTCGNNRTRAAEKLGISIRTLRNKLQEYEKEK